MEGIAGVGASEHLSRSLEEATHDKLSKYKEILRSTSETTSSGLVSTCCCLHDCTSAHRRVRWQILQLLREFSPFIFLQYSLKGLISFGRWSST